jgi:hypothetical protein
MQQDELNAANRRAAEAEASAKESNTLYVRGFPLPPFLVGCPSSRLLQSYVWVWVRVWVWVWVWVRVWVWV